MSEPNYATVLGVPEHTFRLIIGRTQIDYDTTKELANRKKHKYSLESAMHFLSRRPLPVPQPAYLDSDPFIENGEVRHMHMTLGDEDEVVFFVTTMRDKETVRVISLRSADQRETELYYAQTKG